MLGNVQLLQYLYAAPPIVAAVAMMVFAIRGGPSWWARWNESRRDVSNAKAGDWTRLREEIERRDKQMAALDTRHAAEINRVDARCAAIEEREQDCQRQLGETQRQLTDALHRIGELEGYNIGQGEARQTSQMIVSHERQIDAAARKAPRKPGLRRDKP